MGNPIALKNALQFLESGIGRAGIKPAPSRPGCNRKALDDILREVASAGVYVSAHPDVIAKMGVKAVLHRTRTMGWEPTLAITRRWQQFEDEFPKLVAEGPRVVKPNRGNGGIGVLKVENASYGTVRVQEAGGDGAICI